MLCLPYYAYVFSSTKSEIRTEQVLLRSKGGRREMLGEGGQGGEMTQTMYAYVNKWIMKKSDFISINQNFKDKIIPIIANYFNNQ
jgi:hypothetical protein